MKTLTKILALVMALAMVFAAVACTVKTETASTETKTETTTTTSVGTTAVQDDGVNSKEELKAAAEASGAVADPDAMLIYNIYSDWDNQMNPYLAPAYDNMRQVLCSPLVMSHNDTADMHYEYDMCLAESVTRSDDGLTFTVKIKDNANWHDGKPVTAHDVCYTVNTLGNDPEILYAQYYYYDWDGGVWEEVDEKTFKVTYTNPLSYESFCEKLYSDITVCPAHIFEGITGEAFNSFNWPDSKPIGNGPFKYVESVQGEYMLLERFEEYYEPALVKYIRLQFITEDTIAVMAMQSGELDITRTWDAVTGVLIEDPTVSVLRFNDRNTYCLHLNTGAVSTYSDIAVRKALACLIDRETICSTALGNMAVPKYSFIDELSGGYNADVNFPYAYDPAQAAKYLEEAGYVKGADGYYAKDGQTLVINFEDYHGAGSDQEKLFLILQQEGEKIGLKVEVNCNVDDDSWDNMRQTYTMNCFISKCYFDSTGSAVDEMNAVLGELGGYYLARDTNLNMMWGNAELLPEIQALIDEGQAAYDAADEAACKDVLDRIFTYLNNNLMFIPIYDSCTAFSARAGIHMEDCTYHNGCDQQYFNRIWVEK